MNIIEKYFLVQKIDECRNKVIAILTLSKKVKSKKVKKPYQMLELLLRVFYIAN